jgi:cytolysin (calcineurin-like family phosphatase)
MAVGQDFERHVVDWERRRLRVIIKRTHTAIMIACAVETNN